MKLFYLQKPTLLIAFMASIAFGAHASAKEKLIQLDPKPLAEFSLVDDSGKEFNTGSLKGRWTIATIGFVSCPDVCPVILANLRVVSNQLSMISRNNFDVLFVSVDPDRDKAVLGDYVSHFGHNVTGATGEVDELEKFVVGIDAYYDYDRPDGTGFYYVRHSAFAVVISPDMEIVARLSPPFPALDTAKFLAGLMKQSDDLALLDNVRH